MKPRLTLIAALDENRLLANEHGIPWKLPLDTAHFRAHARDQWLLLGRETFEEMLGWFRSGHFPLVLSSSCGWDPPLGRVVASVPQALALAEAAGRSGLLVCGGASTYAAALPYAARLMLTRIEHRFPPGSSPVFFPAWNPESWCLVSESRHPADAENEHPMRFQTWERVPGTTVQAS